MYVFDIIFLSFFYSSASLLVYIIHVSIICIYTKLLGLVPLPLPFWLWSAVGSRFFFFSCRWILYLSTRASTSTEINTPPLLPPNDIHTHTHTTGSLVCQGRTCHDSRKMEEGRKDSFFLIADWSRATAAVPNQTPSLIR